MADPFTEYNEGLDSPAYRAVAVTPSDSTPLATDARSLYIGVGGDVTLVTSGGDTVLFKNLASGAILPVRTNQVKATGTTALSIVAVLVMPLGLGIGLSLAQCPLNAATVPLDAYTAEDGATPYTDENQTPYKNESN